MPEHQHGRKDVRCTNTAILLQMLPPVQPALCAGSAAHSNAPRGDPKGAMIAGGEVPVSCPSFSNLRVSTPVSTYPDSEHLPGKARGFGAIGFGLKLGELGIREDAASGSVCRGHGLTLLIVKGRSKRPPRVCRSPTLGAPGVRCRARRP